MKKELVELWLSEWFFVEILNLCYKKGMELEEIPTQGM